MTPFFNPGPNPYGAPKVMLAAVGEKMTEVAGEVADGMILHPFTTERYVREVTLPALERGFAKAAATRADFTARPARVRRHRHHRRGVGTRRAPARKQQIAFYGSTPGVPRRARLHGWGELGTELNRAVEAGASGWRWAS